MSFIEWYHRREAERLRRLENIILWSFGYFLSLFGLAVYMMSN